ncbi:uncharacterized protein E6C27_scaffold133G00320 [Cucumis melo var. makuwa]|uniref:Uncharacterized protein n=1 Tax=Cucumis melo var. makuwa TaxID=1194695 RepID=A0A5A7TW48_CUCMM|nr:uncharacterized protein E6C27_scaffold133G00320 [Cucumis melo var. makuwa]
MSKNGGSKRGREVGNDEGDFKKSKKQKSKSKMKKAIRNLQDRGDKGDYRGFEGLVDHTLESEEVDNAKTEDVDTGGTPHWLRMLKEDDTTNGAKHIELKKKPTQYAYHFGDSSDWGAGNAATQEEIHSFSIDRVSREFALLRVDFRV